MSDTTDEVDWQRLNEVFAGAVALDSETAQLEFIRRASDGNDRLRAASEELLRASRQAGTNGFLRADALHAGARAVASNEPAMRGREQIGDYRLVREIGRGGMGTVFLAERQQFRQRVALKIIKRGMDTDEIVRRFERERDVLAELSHPNIARLLDGGTTDDGLPYFVMEYVDGKPITHFCDEKRLTIDERLRLFQKLCGAVAYIHKRSIIHRDIKPSNAVIDGDGEPKLLDFGIAKLLTPVTDARASLTLTAAEPRLLTPDYASPEQLRGERVTAASDVYSLGVLLYELLSGRSPFPRSGTGSRAELLKTEGERQPAAPSTAALTTEEIAQEDGRKEILSPEVVAGFRNERPQQLQRTLRGDLDLITLKALRMEPEQRYATVEELSEDLRRHLAGLPVTARASSVGYRAAKFIRRRRANVAAAAAGVLLSAVAVFGFAYVARRAPNLPDAAVPQPATRSIAVVPFKNLSGNAEREIFADGLTESLIASLSRVEDLKVISRNSVFAFKGRDVDPRDVGRQLNVATVVEGSVRESSDKLRVEVRLVNAATGEIIWSGNHERSATGVFEIEDDIARSTAAQLRLKLRAGGEQYLTARHTNNIEAYQAYTKGRYFWKKKDPENLEKARRFFEEAIRLDPNYALAYNGLANYYASSIWYGDISVLEAVEKTKAAVRKLVEIAPDSAEAHDGLARVAWFDWDWETYRREAEKAVELAPNDAGIWQNYCFMLLGVTGRVEDAIAALRHAYELDPLSPSIGADLGMLLSGSGRFEEAFTVFEKTIETDPNFPGVYANLRHAYEAKGMHVEALDALLKLHQVGGASAARLDEFRQAFAAGGANGLRRKELELMLAEPEIGMNAFSIAIAYVDLGEKERALEWLEKAYAMRHPTLVSLKSAALDALRDDPRFQDLARRVGLPE